MKFENPSTIIDAEMKKKQAERKKRLDTISTANADNLSDEDQELRKQEIYQEGDVYTENSVGEGQFEYRITPEGRGSVPEKKLTDEEYGELQESFIDRLPRSEPGETKKKKLDTEGDTSGKAGEQPKDATETETWETLGSSEASLELKGRAAMRGGRKMGEKVEPGGESEELVMLRQAVDAARTAYATEDYKTTNRFAQIKRILGLKNAERPINAQYSNEYKKYQEKLNELRDLEIGMLKEKYAKMSDKEREEKMPEMKKELGDLATQYSVTEKLELAGARTNARTEVWAKTGVGRSLEGALNWSAKRINDYRKLDPKLKVALSVVLFSVGGIAALSGSVGVLSTVAGTRYALRWLGGAGLGAGITSGLETRSRIKTAGKAGKEKNKILENGEIDWEKKFDAISNHCGEEIKKLNESLQKEKSGALMRKTIGAGVGILVGSGAAFELGKHWFGALNETETVGKLKEGMASLWKSSGSSSMLGVENMPDPRGSLVADTSVENMPDPRGSLVTDSYVENSPKDNPSSKVASKLSGMYDEISDKVKGAASKFEKDYLQGTPSPDKAPTQAGASDGSRFHPTEAGAGSLAHEFFNSGDVEIPKGSSIEREIIKRMQELKIPKAEAGKYAHRMVLRFIEESNGQTTLEKLNLVKPGEIIRFNIDPSNLDNSNIANFRGIAGPSIDISHAGGVAIDDARMTAITEQMEKEALERGETIGGQHSIDDRISDQMEKEAAERNRPFIKNHTIGETNVADMNPENMPDPRGSLVPDTSAENMPDPRGAEPIQSEAEILPTEMANIEKIADIFGNRSFGGNNLAEQIADARNLTGAEFDRAYENIFRNIIGNTFNESGVNNLNAREYLEGNNSKIESLIQFNSEHFTDYSIEPKATETMGSWMSRNIAKALEACGVGYNRFKI
jgi:hypothetical protein